MKTSTTIGMLLLVLAPFACKKPTENIKLIMDTDVIKYTAMIAVTDAGTGSPVPEGTEINLQGEHAVDVYELSGEKEIRLKSGMVTIGLRPDLVPELNEPLTVGLEIKANGYHTATRSLVFKAGRRQQVIGIALSRNDSEEAPVVAPPLPVFNYTVSLNFKGKCPGRSDLEIRPSVYVYFKKSGGGNIFRYLGYMERGNIVTNLLELQESYDFQIVYGGEVYQTTQKIEQHSYHVSLDMPAACNF